MRMNTEYLYCYDHKLLLYFLVLFLLLLFVNDFGIVGIAG